MKKIVDQQSPIVEKDPEQLRVNIHPPLSHFSPTSLTRNVAKDRLVFIHGTMESVH